LKRMLVLLTIAAALVSAQTTEKPVVEKKYYQKVFDIKYGSVNQIVDLLAFYPARIRGQSDLRAIAVGTESEATMQAIEEAIKHYDVPRAGGASARNIELTVYLMLAGNEVKVGDAVPLELDPVVKQLKTVFGYKDFQLLDTMLLRNREGLRGEASGVMSIDVPNLTAVLPFATYNLDYQNATVTAGDKSNLIRIDNFRLSAKIPYAVGTQPASTQFNFMDVGLRTNLDVREGQKVVVGKSKVDNIGRALIVVLTAKAVD
jgi:hypothetical protein